MNVVGRCRMKAILVATMCFVGVAPMPAFAEDDNPFSFGYRSNNQPSQQSYNNDSNNYYRQQYDYNRSQSYGSQQYNYGSQPYTNGSQSRRVGGDDDQPRRHRHRRRHRLVNFDWSEPDRPVHRVRTTFSVSGKTTTSPGKQWWSNSGGWFAYGQNAMCVRTCDGYFFPMGQVNSPTSLDAQKSLCTALCPDAKTELYFLPQGADGIATAVTEDGHPYSKMSSGLRYTKKYDAACTCHAKAPQSRLVALLKDVTLRRGDAVMTVNGVLVFNGAYTWPYRLVDFQILDKAKYYLRNALALAALEKAAMRVQAVAKGGQNGNTKLEPAEEPATFITDNSGKTVRLVGQALSYAPVEPAAPADDVDTAQSQEKPVKAVR